MEKFRISGPEYPEHTDEEIFRMYFENLDLKPEDFDKEMIEIGRSSNTLMPEE